MKKTGLLFLILLLTTSFGMTACSLSAEEKQALEAQVPLAEAYYEEKYDCDIEIVDYSYDYYTSNFRNYLTSEMIFTTSEDTLIRYAVYEDYFSDTRQADEIFNKLKSSLLPQLASHIKNPCYFDYDTNYLSCNNTYIFDSEDKRFFHTYYDEENWVDFFMTEKPTVYFDQCLYIISKETTNHEKITDYINTLFSQYMDISHLEIVFLSQLLYNADSFYNIEGEDGFYASYSIVSDNIYVIEPHYIKIADGIYITSTESDFAFQDTDFVISEKMTLGEAISKYNIAYEDAENRLGKTDTYGRTTPQSFHSQKGYAYKVTFSDSYIKRTDDNYSSWMSCCIKIVPSELDDNMKYFYRYTLQESGYPDFSEDSIDDSLDDRNTTFYFYVQDIEASEIYICLGMENPENN